MAEKVSKWYLTQRQTINWLNNNMEYVDKLHKICKNVYIEITDGQKAGTSQNGKYLLFSGKN